MRWRLRTCPHCGGDLYCDLDEPSRFTCLMCGRSIQAPPETPPKTSTGPPATEPCQDQPWLDGCGKAA